MKEGCILDQETKEYLNERVKECHLNQNLKEVKK